MITIANKLNLVVLVDNNSHPYDSELLSEHGLSIYFEIGTKKYLFDVGASDAFYHNAQKLSIAIEDVDYLFISHGHRDHTGGLSTFLQRNSKAKIYISEHAVKKSFFSNRQGLMRDISMPPISEKDISSRFIIIHQNTKIDDRIELINQFTNLHDSPKGNKTLYASMQKASIKNPDSFDHEIALALYLNNKTIILSACTHNGILNTLAACVSDPEKRSAITAYIGGTHLLDSDTEHHYESEEDIKNISEDLIRLYPNMKLVTGHCTGQNTANLFSQYMKENFNLFYTGFTISI